MLEIDHVPVESRNGSIEIQLVRQQVDGHVSGYHFTGFDSLQA